MAMAYAPPAWVKSDSDTYKRWLSRKANLMIKRHRKRGGTYRVKEAMDAIDEVMHRSRRSSIRRSGNGFRAACRLQKHSKQSA